MLPMTQRKRAFHLLKVLEELDSVRKEHKVKNENLKTLSAKVEQLRTQQGLLLRKKRREKDGHKDPLLEELNSVLESAQKQISSLCEEINTTKHKQQQLTKVAEILGVNPTELVEKSEPKKEQRSSGSPAPTRDSDNESRTSNDSKSANDLKTTTDPLSKVDLKAKSSSKSEDDAKSLGAAHLPNVTKKSEDVQSKGTPPVASPNSKNSPEPHSPCLSKSEDTIKSRDKSRSKSPQPCPPPPSSKTQPQSEEPRLFDISEVFEYYDSGSHWCDDCNAICLTLFEFLLHLHEKKHIQCAKGLKRPWAKKKDSEPSTPKKQKVNVPLKGTEFMTPTEGFYCGLCDELFPDLVEAELHLKSYAHNDKYKKYIEAHINYEAIRREKKKAKLTLAQTQQKRKIAEQKREEYERSRSKKLKKEEEDRKAKSKRYTAVPPPYSEQKRNKTPEKEPAKNSAFKKFAWKPVENKTQAAVSSSKVDTALNKPKEEEPKVLPIKPKGFAIKLLGKPSTVSANASSVSHSATSTAVTTTATSTSSTSAASTTAASTTTTTSPAATKVQPGLPNQLTIRPNLPSPLNIRSPAPSVTMSKPAPLNTFLSIRSSNATSKSIPIVNNEPTGVFSKDLVSRAFGGEVILKEGAQPNATDKAENKEQKKKTGQSPEALQKTKGPDLVKVLVSEKTVENKEVQSVKESSVSKPGPVLTSPSRPPFSGPTKQAPIPESAKVPQTQKRKYPVSNPALFPFYTSPSVKFPISRSTNGSSNSAKSDSTITPSNQKTGNAEFTPTGVQKPQDTKAPSKLEKETQQEVKDPTLSINPTTGRIQYFPVQETKVKDTNVQKLPETKRTPTVVTYVSKVSPNKPFPTPPVPVLNIKPAFNATTKLNQKFKKAPLSLPSSLFGHVQDTACKDIKITSIESQRTINTADKSVSPLLPPAATQVSPILSDKPSSAKPSTLQQELDSYYKLIATEEDPEDLTTSEDQDLETSPATVNVTKVPQQTKVENLPQKKAKLEIAPPPVKTPTKPVVLDVSGEDPDDSDMACEVPDVPSNSVSQTAGWNFMQSSYASNQSCWSNNRQPMSLASGNGSKGKDESKETHVTTAVASESSMEDLSVYVTCDSD
ncbi:hypothetical protein GDO78_022426 [Eleutherodactylus coqui]|uniref:C2H2-type domain-containing protein n=1 Tax=Eleutherodactylus coqui TaxID=57060 RepID=A0A8J6E4X9_ELECQ|nr:hypothetical protein GDO78_022426 [Eleutherodactylus coqui]